MPRRPPVEPVPSTVGGSSPATRPALVIRARPKCNRPGIVNHLRGRCNFVRFQRAKGWRINAGNLQAGQLFRQTGRQIFNDRRFPAIKEVARALLSRAVDQGEHRVRGRSSVLPDSPVNRPSQTIGMPSASTASAWFKSSARIGPSAALTSVCMAAKCTRRRRPNRGHPKEISALHQSVGT